MLEVVSVTWSKAKPMRTTGNCAAFMLLQLLPLKSSFLPGIQQEMLHVSCSREPQWPQVVNKENFKQKPASLAVAEPNPK